MAAIAIPVARRRVVLWLLACCLLVFGMVVLGGATRVSGSGLSMVRWQPFTLLPPLSAAEWEASFAAYRLSPQFRLDNVGMDLAGFRSIFWLEYLHRLAGRGVGLAFALPLAAFWRCGAVDARLARRLLVILALGAAQGLAGWLMVASGLVDRPQVSHLRLATHLLLALTLLAALEWTALDILRGAAAPSLRAAVLPGLAVLTIAWGALVAGLHAGLACDTFPLMDGRVFPDGGLALRPWPANLLDNPLAVQFTHRLLAAATLLTANGLWLARGRRYRAAALWTWVQAGLGTATVTLHVPPVLAVTHQAGAVVLLALAVAAWHAMSA